MLDDQFWTIIDTSRQNSTDCESQAEQLRRILARLSGSEIASFYRIFRQKVVDAYRWDLWGIAYLINGGCSDDGFEYFCYWLIGQGKDAYTSVLTDPQSILNYLDDEDDEAEIDCEVLIYACTDAYKDLTDEEMPMSGINTPTEPIGEPWEEEDLVSRFPKVAERY